MQRNTLCLGIDIGTHAVKICSLTRQKQEYALQHAGMIDLPEDTIVDGALIHSLSVVDAIKRLVDENNIEVRDVAFSISGHSAIIKKFSYPMGMSHEAIEQRLRDEADQHIPYALSDVYLDIYSAPLEHLKNPKIEAVLVAAKKEHVHEYISAIMEAGLNPKICDIDSFALERCFRQNYDFNNQGSIALLNIGASKSTINILTEYHSSFTRDLSVAGAQFTTVVQEIQKLSKASAESYKKMMHKNENISISLRQAFDDAVGSLATDVLRSLDYYETNTGYSLPQTLYLSGGGSLALDVRTILQERTKLTIKELSPFEKIQTQNLNQVVLKALKPFLCVAMGLSLRSVVEG